MNMIAQFFGLCAMAFLFSIYQQNKREKLLLCKLGADVCWVIHYLLLGAYGGMIPNFVGIFRELVFVKRESKAWADSSVWPIIFVLINWALGLRTFSSPVNLLPICASSVVTVSLWLKRPDLTKLLTVPVCICFLIYDIFVGSWAGVVNESISILSIIIYFIKRRLKNEQ